MATETIDIASFAVEAAKSINDLKENIQGLKRSMGDLTVGSDLYNDALKELNKNQAALKNAMHATTTEGAKEAITMDDITKAANGLGTSYNALVKRMADLTQEFRATEDAARRADLAKEINSINKELKQLDAMRGIYGRNVGDYFNQIVPGLKNVNSALHIMGKQPVMGTIMLLAPVVQKIAESLKENETALGAITKLLGALKPVADFFAGILEKIAGFLAQAVEWVLELGERSGISFKKIVAGAVGVGNAIKEFLMIPIRNTIDGAKALGEVFQNVFKGKFKEAAQTAKQAVKDIGDNFKKGFSFKENFAAGQEVGLNFVSGLKSPKVKQEAGKAAQEIAEEVQSKLRSASSVLGLMNAGDRNRDQWTKENEQMTEAILKETTEALQTELDAQLNAEFDAMLKERELTQQRISTFQQFAGAVSSVFGALADIYEADGEENEKAAKKAKGLRTAAAIIDTISGSIAAYVSGVKSGIPAPGNMILGAVQAAAVLAAGYAQIKQINAVKVGDGGGSTSVPAIAAAPAYAPAIPQTRSITGRSEEDRLNRMASKSRVVLVWSDVEKKTHDQRVQIAETAW